MSTTPLRCKQAPQAQRRSDAPVPLPRVKSPPCSMNSAQSRATSVRGVVRDDEGAGVTSRPQPGKTSREDSRGMTRWKVLPLKCRGLPDVPMPFSPARWS